MQDIDPDEIAIEINAFCIEDHKLVDFTNYKFDSKGYREKITLDHLRAALAFPFLHPPYRIGDKHYYEGAAIQCLNDYLPEEAISIEWMLVLDPLRKNMIGVPQNLWEAFAISILTPTIGLTELGRLLIELKSGFLYSDLVRTEEFAKLTDKLIKLTKDQQRTLSSVELMLVLADRATPSKLYLSHLEIPDEKVPRAWGWSRSSLKGLFKIGQDAGEDLANEMRDNNHLP